MNLKNKYNCIKDTVVSSKWHLKGVFRNFHDVWRNIHSNVYTRIKQVGNHNSWEYDLYPTVMFKVHESLCIQLCVCM